MTKEEIKDLIASKIAGQGSAVDAGSALPQILNAIIDSIGEGGGGTPTYVLDFRNETTGMSAISYLATGSGDNPVSVEDFEANTGISEETAIALMSGKYVCLYDGNEVYLINAYFYGEDPFNSGIVGMFSFSNQTRGNNTPEIIVRYSEGVGFSFGPDI